MDSKGGIVIVKFFMAYFLPRLVTQSERGSGVGSGGGG